PKLGTLTCTPANGSDLAPNATLSCTGSYTVTQADLNAGKVDNTATATGKFGDKDYSATASASVPAVQTVKLTLTKAANPTSYSAAGTTITYTYVAKNEGNVTLSGPVKISDDKLGSFDCDASVTSLAPGASVTCTKSYVTTQTDLETGDGSIKNTATASTTLNGNTVTSEPASATVTATQTPALSLTKSVTEKFYSAVGDVLHYTLVATNTGNVTLSNVSISDPKLGTLTCTPAQPASLAPGATLSCTGSYTVTQADLNAGKVDNTATVVGSFGGKDYTATASASVPAAQAPALSLTKTPSPTTYSKVGDKITYSYEVKNTGNITLHDAITVTDDKVTVTCPALPVGGLVPGASITCTASYNITQGDLDTGKVVNTATAKSGAITSNEATATVTAVQKPALSLTKTASPKTYSAVGDKITYSYVVTNSGNVTLNGPFTVSDDHIISPNVVTCPATASLAPGASITCSATYTITQADLNAGSVTNKATATNGKVTSNEATATVTATKSTALVAPTQTTCQQFASGTASSLDFLDYNVKGGKINSVAPGVFFYYSKITAPSPSFTITVAQYKPDNWKVMGTQQIILWDANCVKTKVTGTFDKSTGTVTFNAKGLTTGATYYISIKYETSSLVGQDVRTSPTVKYTFNTSINSTLIDTSNASISVRPK
ncbi:MAG TPA: hypothetical protein VH186_15205, partial [Chloroflexia bacterium]|nr:hypothetical protein [Chloroflexia bacterium]